MASSTALAQVAAAHATLARNLLSSVLALAFPDNLSTDSSAQQDFLLQLPQVATIFAQHNVFAFVTEGKAFDKFQTRVFELIDTPNGVDKRVKVAAFELLAVVVEQSPLDALEALAPKLTERILKMVKYIRDAPRVVASACDVASALVCHVEMYSPEARRDLLDWVSKLLPASVLLLQELSNKQGGEAALTGDDVVLFTSITRVFSALLESSPSAVRSTLSKLEASVVALALYHPAVATNNDATKAAAKCLALISNASDKSHHMWKQVMDKTIEMAHQLMDPIAGKRLVTVPLPTGMKAWLRENEGAAASSDLEALAVYQRMEFLLQRLHVVVQVVEESLLNKSISEREVQQVLSDLVALARRIVTVRAHEVGKQSAISEDGFRLPASVVYGSLPQVHALGLRCLTAAVSRAGICALRHASKIAKTLLLASENVHADAQAALYDTVGVCVRVLGASTLEKIGQPLLEHLVAQCKHDLLDDAAKKNGNDDAAKQLATLAAASSGGGKNSKGKKRKRQVGDLSQLSLDGANGGGGAASFLSARNQRVLVGNVDAALAAIASCVATYGCLLPSEPRSLASEVALLAVQQHAKRRAMAFAPRSGTTTSAVDSIALLLLSDAATTDANGAHATNLVKSVDYWSSPSCASSLVQLLALNVSEALVHPRGPPLSINFEKAIQAASSSSSVNGRASAVTGGLLGGPFASQQQQQQQQRGYDHTAVVPAAAAVRGQMDWEREDQQQQHQVSEPEDEDHVAEVITKRAKTIIQNDDEEQEDVAMEGEEEEEVEEEEEEEQEEDYEDERPVETTGGDDDDEQMATTTTTTATTGGGDDDDDEFPDIVDDEEDDE